MPVIHADGVAVSRGHSFIKISVYFIGASVLMHFSFRNGDMCVAAFMLL